LFEVSVRSFDDQAIGLADVRREHCG
jgi:hypothetical protein